MIQRTKSGFICYLIRLEGAPYLWFCLATEIYALLPIVWYNTKHLYKLKITLFFLSIDDKFYVSQSVSSLPHSTALFSISMLF